MRTEKLGRAEKPKRMYVVHWARPLETHSGKFVMGLRFKFYEKYLNYQGSLDFKRVESSHKLLDLDDGLMLTYFDSPQQAERALKTYCNHNALDKKLFGVAEKAPGDFTFLYIF